MKNFFLFILIFTGVFAVKAQTPEQLIQLQNNADTLAKLIDQVRSGYTESERVAANYVFIPRLVKTLKTENSFNYAFPELESVSIIYPEDRSFRIFTWQLIFADNTYRYFGAIQMNSKDLKLYPLFDHADSIADPSQAILNKNNWYGALYYNITTQEIKKKKYYTLFGLNAHNHFSTKKIADVLTFEDGEPVFGAPIFIVNKDNKTTTLNRFILEFKTDAGVSLNYNQHRKLIIFDHIIPPDQKSEGLYFTYVPDGTYEGFELKKGKWYHLSEVMTEGNIDEFDAPPVPQPKKSDAKDNMRKPKGKVSEVPKE